MKASNNHKLFQYPWGYAESFILVALIFIASFITQYLFKGAYFGLPPKPNNYTFFLVYFSAIIIIHFFINHPIIKWFSSIPATIVSVGLYTVIIIMLGIIPQLPKDPNYYLYMFGLTHITESFPFLIATFLVLTILFFTILKRITVINKSNIVFFLNHFGLFLIIIAGAFGSQDMLKLTSKLDIGDNYKVAFNEYNVHTILPFSIELKKFTIGEYSPEFVIVNGKDDFEKDKNGRLLFQIKDSSFYHVGTYKIEVKSYLPEGVPDSNRFRKYVGIGSCPAANIAVYDNTTNKLIRQGWISSGNFMFGDYSMPLPNGQYIGMIKPQPKVFKSNVRIHTSKTEFIDTVIEVNKPFKIKGWYIYQTGYDEKMGKYSNYSVFQVVYDPWLNVIYAGVFLLLAGAIMLVFTDKQ
jgi:ABC-type transport system involved in cytochrome c biogenesis permease subunit